MWRTPWPWSTAALTLALILVARRLSDVQVELERARAQLDAREVHAGHNGYALPAWADDDDFDMSAEWEQAVPPMDS